MDAVKALVAIPASVLRAVENRGRSRGDRIRCRFGFGVMIKVRGPYLGS